MNISYQAEATPARFHSSDDFIRGLMGPVGSGKSVACVIEILQRSLTQQAHNNVRSSRWAIIRNSYPELKTTTIKTFEEWIPFAKINWQPPIVAKISIPDIGDGSGVEAEVLFLALDRPQDAKKLLSLELTGAWINEAREVPKDILDALTGRVGRYPAKMRGGPSWSGIFMDTNPPSQDSWWYRLAEEELPKGWRFFKQPGALIRRDDGIYIPNPSAENVQNHTLGYEYWERQIPGKQDNWIKAYVLGDYADNMDGKPIYAQFNDTLHVGDTKVIPGIPIYIGLDFGLTPAAAIVQLTPRGRVNVLDEIVSEDMGIKQFTESLLLPMLKTKYRDCGWNIVGDPAGVKRADTDERTVFDELRTFGLIAQPASSNAPQARWESVRQWLNRMSDGEPSFKLDPSCRSLRKGFNGGYRFKRMMVAGERYSDKADKNQYSHCHDALQYAFMGIGEEIKAGPVPELEIHTVADAVVGY